MRTISRSMVWRWVGCVAVGVFLLHSAGTFSNSQETKKPAKDQNGSPTSSYDQVSPVLLGKESFDAMRAKDKAGKAAVMARQKKLLEERYDLSLPVSDKVKMSRGK